MPFQGLKGRVMEIIPPSPASLAAAALALQHGQLVAFPTETVYGLGADATNDSAVARIFAAKGRPQFNPLIVHVASEAEVIPLARLSETAERLMIRFWPGPLTLVLPRLPDSPVSLLCSAGLETLALRCPSNRIARQLIETAGCPIAAPSANRSGRISPTTPQHVVESFAGHEEAIAVLLAGGKCGIGLESTVLDLCSDRPTLLRPGAVLQDEIEETLGLRIQTSAGNAERPTAPGQLTSHYAPALPVRLNVLTPLATEAYLAFGPTLGTTESKLIRNLSESGDLYEAAANLFALLRELDCPGLTAIAVAPIPEKGLGIAINDRLQRAACEKR